jgi:carboxymethylenebutenolidase
VAGRDVMIDALKVDSEQESTKMQEDLEIKTFDGTFAAYVVSPAVTPAPVVVVIQEIFGVNAGIREIANDLAKQGFLAVCPDLFWRFEPGLQLSDHSEADWKKGLDMYDHYDFNDGVKDIEATIMALRQFPGSTGKVGVMGFCLGGLMSFLTAARVNVDAAVEYYGAQTEEFVSEGMQIKKPFMMHLAGEDEFMDNVAQATIRKALALNPHIKIHTYPGRNHAFARPNGDHYDATDAATANTRTLNFFRQHLGLM